MFSALFSLSPLQILIAILVIGGLFAALLLIGQSLVNTAGRKETAALRARQENQFSETLGTKHFRKIKVVTDPDQIKNFNDSNYHSQD